MNISVVMASYNGEKYIEEQIKSIIIQLNENDELVISDDGSKDETIKIIKRMMNYDRRISLIAGPRKGFVNNFENAIKNAKGDVIFLSDQDDIWNPNKIKMVTDIFKKDKNIELVAHNFSTFEHTNFINKKENFLNYKEGFIKNLIISSYYGCCIAFTKEIKELALPFPQSTISHDQYLGLIAESRKSQYFINEDLICRRIHGSNESKKRNHIERILFRLTVFKNFMDFRINFHQKKS